MDKSNVEQFLNEKLDSTDGRIDQNYYEHFMSGLESYATDQHESALKHFERSLEIAKELGNATLEFFAQYGLGYSYALIMQYGQTIICFNTCLDILKRCEIGDRRELCFAYTALGDGSLFIGNSEEALKSYEAVVEVATRINDRESETIGYLKLAGVCKIRLQYDTAIKYYEKCLEITKERSCRSSILRARQGLGDVYKLKGQFSTAQKHYEECLEVSLELNNMYETSLAYAALGDVCRHIGQYATAFSYYERCLELGLQMRNNFTLFRAYLGQGYALFQTGECLKALKSFKECLSFTTEIRDKRLQATSSLAHGDLCSFTENYSEAIEYYQNSLEIADEEELHDIKTAVYVGLGNACTATGKSSEGLEYLEKCLKLSTEVGDQYHECQAYLGLGDVGIVEGRCEAAVSNFLKGLDIATKIFERNCESRAMRSLGDAYMLMSSYEDATTQYQMSLKIAEEVGNAKEKSRSHFGLGKVLYNTSDDYQEAKKHYEKGFEFAAGISGINIENPSDNMDSENGSDEDTDEDAAIDYNSTESDFGALAGYWELGDIHCKLGENDEAIKLFEKCLEIVEETGDMNKKEKACERLVDIYKRQGRHYMMKQFQQKLLLIAKEREKTHLEIPESWKWEENSIMHREKFIKLHEYGQEHPEEVKDINGVRVCCSEEFLLGKGDDETRVYIGLGKDGYEKAVKRLPKDACATKAEQEKQVLNELNSTESNHIVNYWFSDNSDKEHVYLILDLCEETLENFVNRTRLEDMETIAPEIIRQILKGLADLHRDPNPILHRDLKPSNILRNVNGKWLLADFGISRVLKKGEKTHSSKQRGTKNWRAVESYPPLGKSDDSKVRYKKESDIQVAGMVAHYSVTKGEHPFGEERDLLSNLLDGKPVGLDKLKDNVLKDLLSWMLTHDPEGRPSAEEALKHPYLQSKKEQFEMLCKIGNEHEIKTCDLNSNVVLQLNSDCTDWRTLMRADVLKYLSTEYFNGRPRTFTYGSSWTECLRLMRNINQHWKDRPRPKPQPEAFYLVGDLQEYFLKVFPNLPIVVHRVVRSCDWKERAQLRNYFKEGTRNALST